MIVTKLIKKTNVFTKYETGMQPGLKYRPRNDEIICK